MAASDGGTPALPPWRQALLAGQVLPAHPLALAPGDGAPAIDERHQRALTRYYVAAGAGGMAVGVHTTGFRIHDPAVGWYAPVLQLAAETASAALAGRGGDADAFVRVAGLVGDTAQAVREAEVARALGYHAGLLSLGVWRDASEEAVLAHCRTVAEAIPLFGFYLQPAVGGRRLSARFWRAFAEIPQLVAIKVAPFDRYATLDVVDAVAAAGRDDVALYTGNDDAIVHDLLTRIPVATPAGERSRHFVGGLLGQWAVWTRRAVQGLERIRAWHAAGDASLPAEWLAWGAALKGAGTPPACRAMLLVPTGSAPAARDAQPAGVAVRDWSWLAAEARREGVTPSARWRPLKRTDSVPEAVARVVGA